MPQRLVCVSALVVLFLAAAASAAIKTETVEYKSGDTVLKGYLAYPSDMKDGEKRPAVIVVHEWWGLNEYPRHRARQLAELGYVAFAADIYGGGKVTDSADEAGKLAGQFKGNRALLRERLQAAVEAVKGKSFVDGGKLVCIGYCFGGTAALEAARAGLPLAGVVSFHGGLDAQKPAEVVKITPRVLVLTGADDPMAKPAQVAAFEDEMRMRDADYVVVSYGGAVHGFTNPAADKLGMKGVGYNAKADKRSWEQLEGFLEDVVGEPHGDKE